MATPTQELPPVTAADAPQRAIEQLDRAEQDFDALRAEVNLLRRRDETLNFHMHRLDEELRLAASLQQDFLPKSLPQIGPLHFHLLFRPAGYVSGDMYDVMRLDERRVGFYIADAVGHGMPAALLAMFLKHALITKQIDQTIPGRGYRILDPGEALCRLNDLLLAQNLSGATFATALYGVIDVETLELRVARAGHPAPILMRPGSAQRLLEPQGALLGILPEETFETHCCQLAPGDRLALFTDGVEVAFSDTPAADDVRWKLELEQRRDRDGARLIAELADLVDHASGSIEPKDDLTILIVDVAKPDSSA